MEGDCVGVEGSWENGVCLPWNQPVIPGDGVPERGEMLERGREGSNSGLKTNSN